MGMLNYLTSLHKSNIVEETMTRIKLLKKGM